jgi:hypothetical protein
MTEKAKRKAARDAAINFVKGCGSLATGETRALLEQVKDYYPDPTYDTSDEEDVPNKEAEASEEDEPNKEGEANN